jgi:hypothetical protein
MFCENRTCERYANRSAQAPQARAEPRLRAMRSRSYGKLQRVGAGRHFSVLDFFGNYAKR